MKNIQARFQNIKEKNPDWGDYYCFVKTVSGQAFSKDIISRKMTKLLVENHDYQRSDKKELLRQLVLETNTPRNTEKGYKNPLGKKFLTYSRKSPLMINNEA